jgi:hypothetical protein
MGVQVWTAVASAVVAVFTFIFSVRMRYRAERESTLRDWQRVVIYSLIEESVALSFDDLKSRYLQKAGQLLTHNVPKKDIQDDALKRILLDLQKDNLVIRHQDRTYQIQYKVAIEAWAMATMRRIEKQQDSDERLKPKILSIVETASGK